MAGLVRVTKSDPPESTEILAEAIVRLGESVADLKANGMNEKAIIILLQAETKLNRSTIKLVLDSIPRLKAWYCTKKVK